MTTAPTIIGIDLGKNWFHLIGLDARGATVLRKKLNRGQLATYAATAPRAVVATEACAGSQYWGRVFARAGHDVRIVPAQFVKPYVKANKNDFHDAAAIAEAANRASMRCVPLKTTEQLELQALHRLRQRAVRERTAVVNQMRALLLEHGIVVPLGRDLFARRLTPAPPAFTPARPGTPAQACLQGREDPNAAEGHEPRWVHERPELQGAGSPPSRFYERSRLRASTADVTTAIPTVTKKGDPSTPVASLAASAVTKSPMRRAMSSATPSMSVQGVVPSTAQVMAASFRGTRPERQPAHTTGLGGRSQLLARFSHRPEVTPRIR